MVVGFNGKSHVGDGWFDGLSDGAFEVTLPANLLQEGGNTMSLRLPLDCRMPAPTSGATPGT